MLSVTVLVGYLCCLSNLGCLSDLSLFGEDDPEVGTSTAPIQGLVSFQSCTPDRLVAMNRTVRAGKWLVNTPEFEECIMNGYKGVRPCDEGESGCTNYWSCDEDDSPWRTSGLWAARSPNDAGIQCVNFTDEGIGGYADIEPFGHTNQEEIKVANWLIDQKSGWDDGWERTMELGNVVWHELMHQHGFDHGDTNDEAMNRQFCGRPSGWIWNVHSMPYFAGTCLEKVGKGIAVDRMIPFGFEGQTTADRGHLLDAAMWSLGIQSDLDLFWGALAASLDRTLVRQNTSPARCLQSTLDVSGVLAITQQLCDGADDQLWIAVPLLALSQAGSDYQFLIMNIDTGMCIDRPWGEVATGTQLWQYDCNGTTAQRFVQRTTDQWEAISALGQPSGQCLGIPGGSLSNGVRLEMQPCLTTGDRSRQVFTLTF